MPGSSGSCILKSSLPGFSLVKKDKRNYLNDISQNKNACVSIIKGDIYCVKVKISIILNQFLIGANVTLKVGPQNGYGELVGSQHQTHAM